MLTLSYANALGDTPARFRSRGVWDGGGNGYLTRWARILHLVEQKRMVERAGLIGSPHCSQSSARGLGIADNSLATLRFLPNESSTIR